MKYILLYLLALLPALPALCQTEVRFNNEASDTTRLTAMLDEAAKMRFANPEARVAFFGRKFIGIPYQAHTLEHTPEMVTVNLDSLDCTTFVETAMALAYTAGEGRTSWRDFVYNLRRLRYRGGEVDGYPSRLHYNCDWAVDNQHRGNFTDVTRDFPRFSYILRTIDFMTANRSKYPALADDEIYARIRRTEEGYRQHRFPYIRTSDLGKKEIKEAFHDGDVVGLVSVLKNLDVTHMGMVVISADDGEPHLLHASSSNGKVEISSLPLNEFMKKNRQWLGLRVYRLAQ